MSLIQMLIKNNTDVIQIQTHRRHNKIYFDETSKILYIPHTEAQTLVINHLQHVFRIKINSYRK